MLVQKVRDNIQKLLDLDDSVKADELKSQLKSLREGALRQLRDKNELFAHGDDIIKLGEHHFSVNTKKLDVTLVQRDGKMFYHLTGTSFFDPVTDEAFNRTQAFWNQLLISENENVYRSEYLAYIVYRELAERGQIQIGDTVESIQSFTEASDQECVAFLQKYMSNRYEERYVKGVHDVDAAAILKLLLTIHQHADLLTFAPGIRAAARYFWHFTLSEKEQSLWKQRLKAYGLMNQAFDQPMISEEVRGELTALISQSEEETHAQPIADYLFLEMSRDAQFIISPEANQLKEKFETWLKERKLTKAFTQAITELSETPLFQVQLYREWLERFVTTKSLVELNPAIEEAAVSLLCNSHTEERLIEAQTTYPVKQL
ncbi:hypothetical protein AC249_AIPGENE2317, partial [Exaiptasia diaphana]